MTSRLTSNNLWVLGQVLAVVAGNAVPLIGVYAWGWDPRVILLIYWFETVIIGGFTTLKLALALPSYQPQPGRRVRYYQKSGTASRSFEVAEVSRLRIIPAFVFGYTVALAFVFFLGAVFLGTNMQWEDVIRGVGVQWRRGLLLLSLLLLEHGVAAYNDYFRGPDWARSDPVFHLWRPAGRFVLFYFLIFIGAFVVSWSTSRAIVIVFVALKFVAELCSIPFSGAPWKRSYQ